MQPLACKINVFSDVDMQVGEGGQAVFFQVASGQSVSRDRSEELNNSICDVRRVGAKVHRPPILNLDWSSCALHRDFASSVSFDDVPTKSYDTIEILQVLVTVLVTEAFERDVDRILEKEKPTVNKFKPKKEEGAEDDVD